MAVCLGGSEHDGRLHLLRNQWRLLVAGQVRSGKRKGNYLLTRVVKRVISGLLS